MAGDEEQKSSEQVLNTQPGLIGGGNADFPLSIQRPSRVVYEKGPTGVRKSFYTGANRVNANNEFEYVNGVAQGVYDEVADAKKILYSLNDIDRAKFLKDVSIALGGSYSPSKIGLLDKDFGAVGIALRQANGMGRTVDVALAYMIQQGGGFISGSGGAGKKIVVTSEDDIKPVANELSLQLLGRIIEPQKMQRLIKFVQQEESDYQSAGGGTVEATPQLQNMVTQQLIDENPEEAQMQGTASVVEMIKRALGA